MDIRMPELDGLSATERILAADVGARVLILTTFDHDEYVYEALRIGASGFVLKDDPPEQLIGAIRTIAEGDAIVPATPPLNAMAERRFDPAKDTLRFAWPRASGARAYEVRIIPQLDSSNVIFTDPSGRAYYEPYAWGGFLAYVDTSVTIAGTARQNGAPVFQAGARYVAIVSAVDNHYFDYFSHESDPYTDTPLPSSLRGGIGVFGAIVPIVWQSIVVEGSPGGP